MTDSNPSAGNGPVMSRRALLTALPATGLTVAAAVPALGAPVDPHPEWLAEFRRLRALWIEAEEDSAEEKRLWALGEELENRICQTPARTGAGLHAQIEWLLEDGRDLFVGCDNHLALVESVLRGLGA